MKKLHVIMLTLLMLLVGVVSINAKDKKEEPVQCVITLQNGDKVSGYVFNVKTTKVMASMYGQNVIALQTLFVSPSMTGKIIKYTADDVKEFEVTVEGKTMKFLSLYTTKVFTMPKDLKPTSHRYFWQVAYEGKDVIGLLSPTIDRSYNPWTGTKIEESIAFSYCLKDDNVAVTYFVPESGSRAWPKKTLRMCFERFPKMDEYLESDAFSLKDMKKHPLDLLRVLERKLK